MPRDQEPESLLPFTVPLSRPTPGTNEPLTLEPFWVSVIFPHFGIPHFVFQTPSHGSCVSVGGGGVFVGGLGVLVGGGGVFVGGLGVLVDGGGVFVDGGGVFVDGGGVFVDGAWVGGGEVSVAVD